MGGRGVGAAPNRLRGEGPWHTLGPVATAMETAYHAIYLSPHLDDAVLSCGGQIAARCRRGERVLVATLAAGDSAAPLTPLARELHAAWKLADSCAPRRAEDRAACAVLGADCLHVPLPEASYRRHPETGEPLYAALDDVFGALPAGECAEEAWVDVLRGLPPAQSVATPLGAGGHVDHRLVRRAAERAFGANLAYYEDYPYAGRLWAVRRLVWPPWRCTSETIRL